MKQALKIIAFGVCLGLILVFIQITFQIEKNAFIRGYWIIAPAIVIGAVLFNVIYNISYQRKMRRIAALLDAGEQKEYIAEVEKLLQTAKGESLRNILKLNLAAGYIDIKQYDTAINMLEELADKRLSGSAPKMIRRLNLCMSYFYAAQYDKATKLYDESQRFFEPYRSSAAYGASIAVVDVLAAVRNEEYDRANQLLDKAKESWKNPRFQNAFQELSAFIIEQRNEQSSE